MTEPVLLDTDILLEVIRNRDPIVSSNATAYLSEHQEYTLSCLTVLELALQRYVGQLFQADSENTNVSRTQCQAGKPDLRQLSAVVLVRGLHRLGRLSEMNELLNSFSQTVILPLDLASARRAGQIQGDLERNGIPIGRIDPMIAAIAIEHSLPLCTGNGKHFERVVSLGHPLSLVDWREPTP